MIRATRTAVMIVTLVAAVGSVRPELVALRGKVCSTVNRLYVEVFRCYGAEESRCRCTEVRQSCVAMPDTKGMGIEVSVMIGQCV